MALSQRIISHSFSVRPGIDSTRCRAQSSPANATTPNANEAGPVNGEFTFTRSGPTNFPLELRYGVGGSAVNGFDYVSLPGTLVFAPGVVSMQ